MCIINSRWINYSRILNNQSDIKTKKKIHIVLLYGKFIFVFIHDKMAFFSIKVAITKHYAFSCIDVSTDFDVYY
jgi:hypothetical protein